MATARKTTSEPPEETGKVTEDTVTQTTPPATDVEPPDENPEPPTPTLTEDGEKAMEQWAAGTFNPRSLPWPGY